MGRDATGIAAPALSFGGACYPLAEREWAFLYRGRSHPGTIFVGKIRD